MRKIEENLQTLLEKNVIFRITSRKLDKIKYFWEAFFKIKNVFIQKQCKIFC